eukprot:evm.model.NODE_20871_length_13631_cov_22.293596.1
MVEGFVCECQRRQLQCICRKEAAASIIARKSATSAVRLIHALHDRTDDPMSFFERLEARVKAVDSLLCVGLDPHAAQLPEPTGAAAYTFCKRLIESTLPQAAAYKPNIAFFEALGMEGWQALLDVMKLIPAEVPVLLDAKRGDISTTADAYAMACLKGVEAFRIAINAARKRPILAAATAAPVSSNSRRSSSLKPYQSEFIRFALEREVLLLGSFTLKSGRVSPYFFNAGKFTSGLALKRLSHFYAQSLLESKLEFDVLFGPAYKGITLASAVAVALAEITGRDVPFAYDRKEAKDHGEGGKL